MIKNLLLFVATLFSWQITSAQLTMPDDKECRISTGIGFAGAPQNVKSIGFDFWVQLDYKLVKNFSIATEFENMDYKQDGYYSDLPADYKNIIHVVNNNFSLLIKYHLLIHKKLKFALASGWTFSIRQSDYFIFENDGITQHIFPNVTSFSDYRIPLLVEAAYPVSKKLNVEVRGKYNLNPQNGDTYSGGIGLSLRL